MVAYSNDCFGYRPTEQVIKEGGHESIGITLWLWGRNLRRYAGFFVPSVEQSIVSAAASMARRSDTGSGLRDMAGAHGWSAWLSAAVTLPCGGPS